MLRLVVRPVIGIAATSLLAGPSVVIISILCIELARFIRLEHGQYGSGSLEGLLAWAVGSIIFGFWITLPASIANAAVLSFFASRGVKSSIAAAALGFIGGCAVLAALLYMRSLPPPFTAFGTIVADYPQQIAMILAGTLMGLVYWLIAIRERHSVRPKTQR